MNTRNEIYFEIVILKSIQLYLNEILENEIFKYGNEIFKLWDSNIVI